MPHKEFSRIAWLTSWMGFVWLPRKTSVVKKTWGLFGEIRTLEFIIYAVCTGPVSGYTRKMVVWLIFFFFFFFWKELGELFRTSHIPSSFLNNGLNAFQFWTQDTGVWLWYCMLSQNFKEVFCFVLLCFWNQSCALPSKAEFCLFQLIGVFSKWFLHILPFEPFL